MSRALSAASLVISAGAVAGVVFASAQMGRMASTLERVEARLISLEKATGVAPGSDVREASPAGADVAAATGPIVTLGDAIREVKKLRDEVAVLQEREPGTSPAGSAAPSKGSPAVADDAVMRKVVEDVLAAKEKERVEADKKRMADWAKARLDRTINDLTEKLQLSSTQKDEIAKILTVASAQQHELWANRKEGENPWEKSQAIRKEQDAAVKPLLTGEQQVKYDEYMKFAGGPRSFSMDGGGGGVVIQPGGNPPR